MTMTTAERRNLEFIHEINRNLAKIEETVAACDVAKAQKMILDLIWNTGAALDRGEVYDEDVQAIRYGYRSGDAHALKPRKTVKP